MKRILTIAGIVIAACIVLAIIGALLLPESDETTPTAQALATDILPERSNTLPPPTDILPTTTNTLPPPTGTIAPTNTPRATQTSASTSTVAPTNTPLATKTPAPTSTIAPTSTPAPTKEPQPNVVIANVYNNGYIERVRIENIGDAPADLSGWTVSGSKGNETYHFPEGYILAAGTSMRLHSGDDGVENPPSDIWWTEKTVWNNSGETVFLKDAAGNPVDQYSW